MRSAVFVLVLMNLGFLAWASWFAPQPPPGNRFDGPTITLLREREAEAPLEELPPQDPDPVAVTEPETTSPPADDTAEPVLAEVPESEPEPEQVALAPELPGRCIAIGPFTDSAAADSVMATLLDAGFDPEQSSRQEEVRDGYWVYIEQIDSMAAAREIDAVLAENGLADAYPIANSDSGILISLGVFSEITRAGSQAERVSSLGYEATIADSIRVEETYWLDLSLSGEESVALELLQQPGRISRFEETDCEQTLD